LSNYQIIMPEPVKLLLIEDNIADARFIEILLREITYQRYDIQKSQTFREGKDLLSKEVFDLLVLDLSLPDSVGLETIQNANKVAPELPIIVLTGRSDEDFAVEVVKAGAQDYLVKGEITSTLLSRAIRYAIKRKEMEVDLKTVKRRIEESENKLNTIIKHNISGIIVLDKDNNVKFTNPAAETMLGKKESQILGNKFNYEYSLETPSLVSVSSSKLLVELQAVQTKWGGEDSTLITLHNITELKNAEESLRLKNNKLTRINKALDKFVYIISHDLKKPTANIIGLLSLYEKEIKDGSEKSRTIFQKLNFSALQLKKMIEDLLDATKREGFTEQNFEMIDLKNIYSEVESSMDQLIIESKVKINTDFSKCPLIFYSFQDLKSIMANLLSNAVKYKSNDRPGVISIKSETVDNRPVLSFTDNGIGIDLEKQKDKLFKKYERFNTDVEGTGLGLWIVKETIEKNGGKVEVESNLNEGTTFKVIF
jgi:signal transduction histidine kinase/DNA-binding response OmpR family regulator